MITTIIRFLLPWLIDQSNFKNKKVKDVGVYSNQPLVIINHGNAKGKDILHFANEIKGTVYGNFEIELEERSFNSLVYSLFFVSIKIVTGPSLTNLISISAPKTPVLTLSLIRALNNSTKCSYKGIAILCVADLM